MWRGETSAGPADKAKSRDPNIERVIKLAREFLAANSAETKSKLKSEIVECCHEPIKNIVRGLVFTRGFGPPGEDPQAIVEEITNDVIVKVLLSLNTLQHPEYLMAWLRRISMLTIIDTWDEETGGGTILKDPLEKLNEEGEEVSRLDEGKARQAALGNVGDSLRIMADTESWIAAIENRDLLNKAAAIHSRGTKRDFQSACWLKVTWDYPTVPLEAIAAHRKTTVDDVYHLLKHDNKELIPIVKGLLDRAS